jgi:hypothetical protein
MTQLSMLPKHEGFGATERRDTWWLGPLLVLLGLSAFLIYGTWAAWQGDYFEIRADKEHFAAATNRATHPYLSPFFSPLLYDPISEHAWFKADWRPSWMPSWFPFSAGFLILAFPGFFRLTCYYYRKAYYRAFWADPPACAVGEPRKTYWGENHWPLLLQNCHRYFLYAALIFILILGWDALLAFRWPTNRQGLLLPNGEHTFGMGLGTLLMVVNVLLITGFTFGCNSLRHLVGGRLDCFSCPHNVGQVRTRYKLWRGVTWFNNHHMEWAWVSLISVGFVDLYIRLCAAGVWSDVRFF